PGLEELLHDPDASVRSEASLALQRLSSKGRPPEELKSVSERSRPGGRHEWPAEEPNQRAKAKVSEHTKQKVTVKKAKASGKAKTSKIAKIKKAKASGKAKVP